MRPILLKEQNEGWREYRNRASIHDNPYDKKTDLDRWLNWREGFIDAKEAEDSIGDW